MKPLILLLMILWPIIEPTAAACVDSQKHHKQQEKNENFNNNGIGSPHHRHLLRGDNNRRRRRRRNEQEQQQLKQSTETEMVVNEKPNHEQIRRPHLFKPASEIKKIKGTDRRFFVKYKNEKGKIDTLEAATDFTIELDDTLMVASLNSTGVERLQNDDNVLSMEEDHQVVAFDLISTSANDINYNYQDNTNQIKSASLNDHGEVRISTRESTKGHPERTSERTRLKEVVPYGTSMIQADQMEVGPYEVKVCIVDSGIALEHPDIDKSLITGQNNTEGEKVLKWNEDIYGHGTQVAGTMASIIGNNQGIRGIGRIRLHVTRGLDNNGIGYESFIWKSIHQCITSGSKIINLSLGSSVGMSDWMNELYSYISQHLGIMIIAASGNDGTNTLNYPASHPDIISVGAVDQNGNLANFSNFGEQIELVAPGSMILSTAISSKAIVTEDFSYPAYQIGTQLKQARGRLKYCSIKTNDRQKYCGDVAASASITNEPIICLVAVSRQTIDFGRIIELCGSGRGVGAIIFSVDSAEDRYYVNSEAIPLFGVSYTIGLELIKIATVADGTTSFSSSIVTFRFSSDEESPYDADRPTEYTYNYFSGTSMATPHVSAAAAMVWSHFPNCTSHQIRYALARTAVDKGIDGCDERYGYGIVNAKAAFDFILAHNNCTISKTNYFVSEEETGQIKKHDFTSYESLDHIPLSVGGCSTVPPGVFITDHNIPLLSLTYAPRTSMSTTNGSGSNVNNNRTNSSSMQMDPPNHELAATNGSSYEPSLTPSPPTTTATYEPERGLKMDSNQGF